MGNYINRSVGPLRRRVILAAAVVVVVVTFVNVSGADTAPPREVDELAIARSSADLSLAWGAVTEDITGGAAAVAAYRVYGADEPDFPIESSALVGESASTTFVHTGQGNTGPTKFYLVSAVNEAGIEGNTRNPLVRSVAIASLSYDNGVATVGWTPSDSSDVGGYRVYTGSGSLWYTTSTDVPAGQTVATLSNLVGGSSYYIAVAPVDSLGNMAEFLGEAVLDFSGAAASPPGIGASLTPSPPASGWYDDEAAVAFSCSGADGGVNPITDEKAPGALFGFSNVDDALDQDLETRAKCKYTGATFCGSEFSFSGGTLSGQVKLEISHLPNCLGQPVTIGEYSTDGGANWTMFIDDEPGGTMAQTFLGPMLVNQDLGQFRVRVLGSGMGTTCGNGFIRLHEIDFLAAAACSDSVTVAVEGRGQVVSGTAVGPGGLATVHLPVNIDHTGPVVEASVLPEPNAQGWNNTPVTVAFACADSLSGVAACHETMTVVEDGASQPVMATGADHAGNDTVGPIEVNIDTVPPSVLIEEPGDGASVVSPVLISGTASDAHGVESIDCNGQVAEVVSGQFSCLLNLDAQVHEIEVRAMDPAGNVGESIVNVSVE